MTPAAVIDSHQHFWDPASADYPWMTEDLSPIHRSFGPEDLRGHLRETGVTGTILVQTRASFDETCDFLAIASATDFVAGVIGWVDLTDPSVAERIAELRERDDGHLLVGIRHQVHDEPDPEWLLRDDVQRGLRAVAQAGLVYDFLVRPRELPAALETARRHPDLRFVIDHIAKPDIAGGEIDLWCERLRPFGDLEHVACKLSGLVTEADWQGWGTNDLVPYIDHVLGWFGETRLMFGSDWPVCLLAASYAEVMSAAEEALAASSRTTRDRIFFGTALEVYDLAI